MELTIFAFVYFLFRLGHYIADGLLVVLSYATWPLLGFRKGQQWWLWRQYKAQTSLRFAHNAVGTGLLVMGLVRGYKLALGS